MTTTCVVHFCFSGPCFRCLTLDSFIALMILYFKSTFLKDKLTVIGAWTIELYQAKKSELAGFEPLNTNGRFGLNGDDAENFAQLWDREVKSLPFEILGL